MQASLVKLSNQWRRRTNVPTAANSPTGETVAGDQLRTHSAIPLSELPPMKWEPPNSKLTAGFVSHRRGIGRLFGNGICPPIGGSFALADACAFGARFRMASAALWKAATAWSSALRR